MAKILFIMQLLVSWVIVVISTLYAYEGSAGWIVSDSSRIVTLGETVFFLTVGASFLISFDSYINAKARSQPLPARFVFNPDGVRLLASALCAPPAACGAPAPRRHRLLHINAGGRRAGGS